MNAIPANTVRPGMLTEWRATPRATTSTIDPHATVATVTDVFPMADGEHMIIVINNGHGHHVVWMTTTTQPVVTNAPTHTPYGYDTTTHDMV